MFPPPRPSPSCSDDRSSARDAHPKFFHRHYVHDLSTSSHSLATTNSLHDDLPTPSMPAHVSHTTSTHSTPMTSPSTGYSSLFPGSLSSATSESVPSAESNYRSEFGLLIPTSVAHSPIHGSASSRSSRPISSRSRSTAESGPQTSSPRVLYDPSRHSSNRPGTAPIVTPPPILAASSATDNNPADHHARSHSRLTVSIKNLFSRHPGPSPSRFSLNSATTTPPDSETSSSSFHVPASTGKWSTPRKSRLPDLEISGSVAPAMSSPSRGPDSPIDAHRRYASEASPKMYTARTGSGMPTSQENLDVSNRNIPPTRGREAKPRNVLRRRPSGSAKLFKGRERGMSSPSSRQNEGDADPLRLPPKEGMSRQIPVPFPLTPAGAVVEAYKQQELHRDDRSSPPKLSIDDPMNSTTSHDAVYDQDHPEHSPTPYYTVFGSSSERRVKAGGPDDRWAGSGSHQRIFIASQVTSSHQPSMSDPGGRNITRKLSNRWLKAKGGVVPEESHDRGHAKGRPSMQEIWGADKSLSRPTGQSIDGVLNPRDGAWASPSANHARSESKGDKGEGPKLWRIMRRISTGGLRDRFQSDKAAPPVPALPKELLKVNQSDYNSDPLSTPRHKPSSSLRGKDHHRTDTIPGNIVPRPSAATSSSSPNSSDVASMQFFKTPSARSSMSSYGEAVVRVTEPTLDRHIITPREQLRLADGHVESGEPSMPCVPRSPRRTTSVPAGLRTVEDGESDYLALPSPRCQTCTGESPTPGSSRPCSTCPSATSGSACASYQSTGATIGLSRMADGIVSLSPPPRTAKTLTRGGSVASSPSHSKQTDGGGGIGIGGARQMDRIPSSRSDMTARFESPEPGESQDKAAPPPTQSQYTFRELDAPRNPPLSEREKTDIWNDLLARSDKAGGTLHINGAAELLSDNMRLSTYSEISRVLD